MAEYDLTPRIAPNLDRHLVFPLLEFLQERQLYNDNHILKAKIDLLNNTNMVDYAMDIHKTLYQTEDVPQEMVERRADVVARLKSLEDAAAPLVAFLQNPSAVQELRADKLYNLQMLNDKYQIGSAQIEALYQYGKFQFECGNYSGAADYLYQYRALCTNSERSLSALWGKLAAEILMQNWDIALEELNRLKEIIDSKNFSSPINQVQSRIWLMHWSLFIFFNHDNGRSQIIDLFNQDKYLNAIQTSAPHLLRYLASAFIVNKRRRPQFKDFIKVIQLEQNSYKDPITEFLACVYVNYDFDGAQKKMRECEEVILNDPFLGKLVEENNFSTVPLRDEFLENARLFIFETYCRIHQRIDKGVLAEKLFTKALQNRQSKAQMLEAQKIAQIALYEKAQQANDKVEKIKQDSEQQGQGVQECNDNISRWQAEIEELKKQIKEREEKIAEAESKRTKIEEVVAATNQEIITEAANDGIKFFGAAEAIEEEIKALSDAITVLDTKLGFLKDHYESLKLNK